MFFDKSYDRTCRNNLRKLRNNAITVFCLVLFSLVEPACAEYQIVPRIDVSEEYNDNLFQTETDRKTDYISRIQPGIAFRYTAPLWDWDLSYGFDFRRYAKRLREDEETHNFTGTSTIRLIDNFMFIDLRDTYSRVSLDVTRTTTSDSLFVNQTDSNVFTASPYFVLHPSASVTVRTGYTYIDTWYKYTNAESRKQHSGFIDASYEMTSKFFLNSSYKLDRELANTFKFYRHEATIGTRYEYAERSFITAQGGITSEEYDSVDTNAYTTSPYWNIGITHTFDTVTAALSSSVRYADDPLGGSLRENIYGFLTIQKSLKKGTITVNSSYSEYFDGKTDVKTGERMVAGMNGVYEIMEHLDCRISFNFVNYRDLTLNGTTKRYYVDSGLRYSFGNNLSIGMSYGYANYESAQITTDNMHGNRVIFDISKVFNQ